MTQPRLESATYSQHWRMQAPDAFRRRPQHPLHTPSLCHMHYLMVGWADGLATGAHHDLPQDVGLDDLGQRPPYELHSHLLPTLPVLVQERLSRAPCRAMPIKSRPPAGLPWCGMSGGTHPCPAPSCTHACRTAPDMASWALVGALLPQIEAWTPLPWAHWLHSPSFCWDSLKSAATLRSYPSQPQPVHS